MKIYSLSNSQTYNFQALQKDINDAGISAFVSRHNDKLFSIKGDIENVDVIVQAHLSKTEAEQLAQSEDIEKDLIASQLQSNGKDLLKAVALVYLDEINELRAQHSLPARTPAQLKQAVKNKL